MLQFLIGMQDISCKLTELEILEKEYLKIIFKYILLVAEQGYRI